MKKSHIPREMITESVRIWNGNVFLCAGVRKEIGSFATRTPQKLIKGEAGGCV